MHSDQNNVDKARGVKALNAAINGQAFDAKELLINYLHSKSSTLKKVDFATAIKKEPYLLNHLWTYYARIKIEKLNEDLKSFLDTDIGNVLIEHCAELNKIIDILKFADDCLENVKEYTPESILVYSNHAIEDSIKFGSFDNVTGTTFHK